MENAETFILMLSKGRGDRPAPAEGVQGFQKEICWEESDGMDMFCCFFLVFFVIYPGFCTDVCCVLRLKMDGGSDKVLRARPLSVLAQLVLNGASFRVGGLA